MKKQLCKVVKDLNRKIVHIVCENKGGLEEGSYFLDEDKVPFVVMCGHLLPVADGGMPKGELLRIHVSSDPQINCTRPNYGFQRLVFNYGNDIKDVYLTYNAQGKLRRHEDRTAVMLKVCKS